MMDEKCPIESTLSSISGKWKILILKELTQKPVRYGVLEKAIPTISAKVLTQQLRELEKDGLVIRTIFPEIPPRVEYSLSAMGVSIFSVFVEIRKWGLTMDTAHGIKCMGCGNCQPSVYYKNE